MASGLAGKVRRARESDEFDLSGYDQAMGLGFKGGRISRRWDPPLSLDLHMMAPANEIHQIFFRVFHGLKITGGQLAGSMRCGPKWTSKLNFGGGGCTMVTMAHGQ